MAKTILPTDLPGTIDPADKDRAGTRMIELQQEVMQARGIVSMAVDSLFARETDKEVEGGLRAAYAILDDLFDRLDPVNFWREAKEVSHG